MRWRGLLLGLLSVMTPFAAGCQPPPHHVVGLAMDRDDRLSVVLARCPDSGSETGDFWLTVPQVAATASPRSPAATPTPRESAWRGEHRYQGPYDANGVTRVPLLDPSSAGWTADRPVRRLRPGARYRVSRDQMTSLAFQMEWFDDPALRRPGVIVVDGAQRLEPLDATTWRDYVAERCG